MIRELTIAAAAGGRIGRRTGAVGRGRPAPTTRTIPAATPPTCLA